MREQTEVLKKIERHLRPQVADAQPIRRPNLLEPAGEDYPGDGYPVADWLREAALSSVPPVLPQAEPTDKTYLPWVEPMSEND
jgi:hypothetical protein